MNYSFLNANLITKTVAGVAATSVFVIVQQQVMAKSATEIAAIAIETTVKIDNTLGIPGGSGVIVAHQGNSYTVLTADHVVQNLNIGYIVKTPTGQHSVSEVKSLKEQTGLDLAVVTFEATETYPVATIGDSEYATAGANVYVSGYPLAVDIDSERQHEFTTGMITSIREGAAEGYAMRYQALTRRGMSGGGVFDTSGRLVGIHGQGDVIGSVKNESSSIPEPLKTGFNAAIPIDNFLNSIDRVGLTESTLIVDDGKPDKSEEKVSVEATKSYVEGVELLQSGDASRANDYLIEAAEANPNNALAVYYQGLIDYTQQNVNSAIANYDRAIEINPNFALAHFSRGLANYRLGNKQKALADYDRAININPVDPWSYLNRGIVKEDLDDVDGALADYDRAINIDPEYGKSYHNRGAIRYYKRDFEGSVADFQKASELFFQQGDNESYSVANDSLNKAQKALRQSSQSRSGSNPIEYSKPEPTPHSTPPQNNSTGSGLRDL